jgi:hypothetical protein
MSFNWICINYSALSSSAIKGLERKLNIEFSIITFWELIRNYISWYKGSMAGCLSAHLPIHTYVCLSAQIYARKQMTVDCAFLQYWNICRKDATVDVSRYNYTKCFVLTTTSGEGTAQIEGKITQGVLPSFLPEWPVQIILTEREGSEQLTSWY